MIENAATGGAGEQAELSVKLGAAEINFKGAAGTLEKLVMPTINRMIDIVDTHVDLQRPSTPPLQIEAQAVAPDDVQSGAAKATEKVTLAQLSTHSIAVALKASTGPELAIAACANLALIKSKDTFTRKEIADEMKTATGIYSANMFGNLSKILNRLTADGLLRLVSTDVYALAHAERTRLEQVLAQIR